MKRTPEMALSLGAEVIRLLVPQRAPFLMVDKIEAYTRKPQPTVWGARHLSINEPIFRGHFPQVALYPGCLIVEGLCQVAHLVTVLQGFQQYYEEAGLSVEAPLDSLRNLERGFRMQPGYDDEAAKAFLAKGAEANKLPLGVAASTNIKFIRPVFAGERLELRATLKRRFDDLWSYDVEAKVNAQVVVKGNVTNATLSQPMPDLFSFF